MAAQSLMLGLGITDVQSYWQKLRTWIVISVIVCACIGASYYGITGLFIGGLLGVAAPAALIWLGVLLIGIALYLAIFCAVWIAIWYALMWLLHS